MNAGPWPYFHRCGRYIVKDLLGHGTFGQVAKCWVPDTNSYVAVKVIKNQPAYYQQALVEVSILTTVIETLLHLCLLRSNKGKTFFKYHQ